MTRINTNVGSLVGRNNLARANSSLAQSLTRLSTGLRINTGADDPAGLIASENLRSDITSINRAIGNTERAEQVIATADSALGQVSSLLNDIRGLVTESANSGALSEEQIEANQLQLDSSLEALNRIAQTTTFQGRRLLDGSLDFTTTPGVNASQLSNLQIDQANLGATGQTNVDINVSAAATQASIEVSGLPEVNTTPDLTVDFQVETTAASGSTGSVAFNPITQDATQGTAEVTVETQSAGTFTVAGQEITLTAQSDGAFAAAAGNTAITTLAINVGATIAGGGADDVEVDRTGTAVTLNFEAATVTVEDVVAALNNDTSAPNVGSVAFTGGAALAAGDFVATTTGSNTAEISANIGAAGPTTAFAGGAAAAANTLTLTAVADQNADGAQISAASATANAPALVVTSNAAADSASFDETNNTLTININSADTTDRTLQEIADLINATDSFTVGGAGANSAATVGSNGTLVADSLGAFTFATAGVDAAQAEPLTLDIVGTDAAGASLNGVTIDFTEAALGSGAGPVTVIGDTTSGFTVQINTDNAGGVTIAQVQAALTSIDEIESATIQAGSTGTGASVLNADDAFGVNELPGTLTLGAGGGGTDGVNQVLSTATFDLTAATGVTGSFDISFAAADLSGVSTAAVVGTEVNGVTPITLQIDNSATVTLEQIRTGLEGLDQIATATLSGTGISGATTFDLTATGNQVDTVPTTTLSVGGSSNGIDADLVFELAGSTGSEVLSFEAGTSLALLAQGVNAVSDATGVTAATNEAGDGLIFSSAEFGSSSIVDIEVISEGAGGDFVANLTTGGTAASRRESGTDIVASVNGISASGDGNSLSINTATLDLSTTVTAGFTGSIGFEITGGGANFQLGPDVVSNQQARLGIGSVNTAALGGVNGSLFQLQSGGSADLTTDPTVAARIVEEAIDQVTSLRGRLGAFQRTTLETNRNALNDTLTNLSEAESSIRDADFAAETAELTRSQILVQSSTQVLAIANQNPQNVLSLLG